MLQNDREVSHHVGHGIDSDSSVFAVRGEGNIIDHSSRLERRGKALGIWKASSQRLSFVKIATTIISLPFLSTLAS